MFETQWISQQVLGYIVFDNGQQAHFFFVCQGRLEFEYFLDNLPDTHGFVVERESADVQAGKIENIVDGCQQYLGGFAYGVDILLLLGGEIRFGQEAGEAKNAI